MTEQTREKFYEKKSLFQNPTNSPCGGEECLLSEVVRSKVFRVFFLTLWGVSLAVSVLLTLQAMGIIAWFDQRLPVAAQTAQPSGYGPYGYVVFMGTDRLSQTESFRSPAVLLEDGRVLGPGNTRHAKIGELGGGRFSFWKGGLYFSASDNSDPRVNRQPYTLKIPFVPEPPLLAFAYLLTGLLTLRNAAPSLRTVLPHFMRWMAFTLALLGIVSTGVFFNRVQIIVIPYRQTLRLDVREMQREIGYAYTAPTDRSELSSEGMSSFVQVLEDGHPLPGTASAPHDDIRNQGQGRYSFWSEYIYFSTSDNSNPIENGRTYEISYPFFVNSTIANTLYLFTAGSWVIFLLLAISNRRRQLAESIHNMFPRIKEFFRGMIVPALIAIIFPGYLLATVPPLFNGTDSGGYYSWGIRDWTPHYKPGYLFFVRSVNNIISGDWTHLAAANIVSMQALYAVIIIQHIVAIFAIAYFASTISKSPYIKAMVACVFSLLPAVFPYSHGIFQEALLTPLVLILSASILRMYDGVQAPKWLVWSIGVALYIMLLIRHDTLPLLLLPAFPFLLMAIFAKERRSYIGKFIVLLTTSIIVFVIFSITMLLINLKLDTLKRPAIYGEAGSYFIVDSSIQHDGQQEQKRILINQIKAELTDPVEQDSVKPIFNSKSAWTEHYAKVLEIVQSAYPNWDGDALLIRTEEILNKIFFLYVKHGTVYYLQTAQIYLTRHLSSNLLTDFDYVINASIMLFDAQQNGVYEVMKDLPIFSDPSTKIRYHFGSNLAELYSVAPTYGTFFIVGALLLLFSIINPHTRSNLLWIGATLLLFGFGHILMMSLAQPALPRYHNIGIVLLFVSITIAIINLGKMSKGSIHMDKSSPNTNATGLATMTSSVEFIDNYNQWMIKKFQPYLGTRLLEIGTGHGNFKKYFPSLLQYISVDINEEVVRRAKEKYPDDIFIVADIAKDEFLIKLGGYKIDTILCTNVMEHIENDGKAIENLLSVLSTGGHLLLFVPAIPALYNDMDRLVGHYRRYTKRMMKTVIGEAYEIPTLEYFNPIGGLGWWVNKFIKHDDIDSKNLNAQVKFFDRYVVPISKVLNPLSKRFFGQSLICVIKKTS